MAWYCRRALPYNEVGDYFDPDEGVVVHEQSVEVYGAVAIAFALASTVIWLFSRKR